MDSSTGIDFDTDGELHLTRLGAGPRFLDATPVRVGEVSFRAYANVKGGANATGDVLLVRETFRSDPGFLVPRAVARIVRW